MPALSGLGDYGVGTEFREMTVGTRSVGVRIWYPATRAASALPTTYRHRHALPGKQPIELAETGIAVAGAPPATPLKYPLVLISHGYGGWAEHFSRLGEALASRGYIVASIDHRDLPFSDAASFATSFGTVLLTRSSDQQQVMQALLTGKLAAPAIAARIDGSAVGLIGYSMGGYGALISAGATVERTAPAFAQLPPAFRRTMPAPDTLLATRVKAVIAMAPWGGQPEAGVWSDAGLSKLKTPLLFISGDGDDVVDFKQGVQRLFEQSKGSSRHLLVFREAAHNIAGNALRLPPDAEFAVIESLTDPVWRKERIAAINQHFIVAFLDRQLKGDSSKSAYLDVSSAVSNDGQWPSQFGQQWGGQVAGDNQPEYWRGFQRRWARGLEMHHKKAGE
jgi:predicted dienelactone hydrolase